MSGLFFSEKPPTNYRDWASTDYTLYDALAPRLHELGSCASRIPGSRGSCARRTTRSASRARWSASSRRSTRR
jgi:hypothetical protein